MQACRRIFTCEHVCVVGIFQPRILFLKHHSPGFLRHVLLLGRDANKLVQDGLSLTPGIHLSARL